MRKLLGIAAGLLMVLAFTVPASADVFVLGDVQKYKTVLVDVDVDITKDIVIDVEADLTMDDAAEAEALANQVVEDVSVNFSMDTENCDLCDSLGNLPWLQANILDSISGNVGITGVNQDVGNNVNQGNVVAFAVTGDETTNRGNFANAEASAEQRIERVVVNTVISAEDFADPTLPDALPQKQSLISNSINNNTGITQVNQSVMNNSNQLNLLAIAAGIEPSPDIGGGPIVALAEADLGQLNADNQVFEEATYKRDQITGSITGNVGITSVNQGSGNHVNQANVIALSVAIAPFPSP
jgi:hypothetical protein